MSTGKKVFVPDFSFILNQVASRPPAPFCPLPPHLGFRHWITSAARRIVLSRILPWLSSIFGYLEFHWMLVVGAWMFACPPIPLF